MLVAIDLAEVKKASRMIEEIVAQSEEQMSLGPVGLDYGKHLCKYFSLSRGTSKTPQNDDF